MTSTNINKTVHPALVRKTHTIKRPTLRTWSMSPEPDIFLFGLNILLKSQLLFKEKYLLRIAVGNTDLCPYQARQYSRQYHTLLVQHEGSCYELLNGRIAWTHAEHLCQQSGGHLAHINNAQEQAYIQSLLSKYSPQHRVWIGLHDRDVEGHFQWTAGRLKSNVPHIIRPRTKYFIAKTEMIFLCAIALGTKIQENASFWSANVKNQTNDFLLYVFHIGVSATWTWNANVWHVTVKRKRETDRYM